MRLGQLLDELKDYNPDDIIAIGVYMGDSGDWNSEPIGSVMKGEGIALLLTPKTSGYRSYWP